MPYTPSLIQTILSVPELRRFLLPQQLADYTAGGDFHPAPKTNMRLFSTHMIHHVPTKCNCFLYEIGTYRVSEIIYRITINND